MNRAVVFNIQRFSLHDGPGIRTTVFLKGCPLSCPWCHNPESRDGRPQVTVQADRCLVCGLCAPACPQDLAGPLETGTRANRPDDSCLRCGACAEACPSGARDLLGEDLNVARVMDLVERDRPYHEESGGGVTFSGGEPVANGNAPFLLECLEECRRRGIHSAVDTCGHVPTETLLAVARQADLILYDLKIMDDEQSRLTIGAGTGRILENLAVLAAAGHETWIRVPLIPGLTDGPENLNRIAEFAAGLPRAYPVQLLPFHPIGRDKYGRLGMDYHLEHLTPAGPDLVEQQAEIVRSHGLEVRLGG